MRNTILRRVSKRTKNTLLFSYRSLFRPNIVTHHGILLQLENDAISKHIRKVVYRGTYESSEANLIRQTLEPSDRVLEVGSGMGFIATFCAKALGRSDAVLAVEAVPKMEPVIRENFSLNCVSPELISAAVGLEEGECSFIVSDSFWSSSAANIANSGTEITVPMVTLSDLIERFGPTYLVVDVEGMERRLFKQDLGSVRKICLEIHPHYIGDAGIRDCLIDLFNRGFVVDFLKSNRCVFYLYRDRMDTEFTSL